MPSLQLLMHELQLLLNHSPCQFIDLGFISATQRLWIGLGNWLIFGGWTGTLWSGPSRRFKRCRGRFGFGKLGNIVNALVVAGFTLPLWC